MADVGIYTKNADIAARAGRYVNTSAILTAETDKYVLAVEALVDAKTRVDWSSKWATLSGNAGMEILTEVAANLCAMKAINYDFSGFPTLAHATQHLNVLRDAAVRGFIAIEDIKVKTFLGGVD